jgi:predicted nucleic acid-binding protein
MKYVLDTNFISETIKPDPDPLCISWVADHIGDCCLTSVTLAELCFGVERLPEGKRKRDLARKYRFILQDFQEWILDFDQAAASEFGRYVAEYEAVRGADGLKVADLRDLQIASIARSLGWTVATRNSKHYPFVDTVNPFEA